MAAYRARARGVMWSAGVAAVAGAVVLGLAVQGAAGSDAKASGAGRDAGLAGARLVSDTSGPSSAAQAAGGVTTSVVEAASKAATVQPCRGDELLVTATHRFAGQQGDHLLITAVNEGAKSCWVTSYPAVVLDWNVHNVALPHSKKDNPGGSKHITLRPGAKAYSAVNLFEYGSKHRTASSLAIALRGANGHVGPYYSVLMKGQHQKFSWTEADVLNWNTEKPYDF